MARLTADVSNAHPRVPFEKDDYEAMIQSISEGPSKATPSMRQITVTFKPSGPKIDPSNPNRPMDWVAWYGVDKNGNPVNLDKLCRYLNALSVEWTCKNCGKTGSSPRQKFVIEKDKMYATCCSTSPQIEFDPDLWVNKRIKVRLDISKMPNSDEETNNVRGIYPLSDN